MYLWMKTACYEHFLLVLIFRVKREENATVGLLSGVIHACGKTDQPKHR